MLLTEALQIPPSARCICAVGAGGKTSLLYELAEEYRRKGKRVLLITTTKMYLPEKDGVLDGTAEEIKEKLERDGFAVAGGVFSEEKMGPLPQAILDEVFSFADVVLVEADGSKRMPLKMPRQGEPVLPETCDFLVTVAGLSALEQPWEQVCHRFALVSSMFSGKTVAEGDIFPLLQAGYSALWDEIQGCVFLNQAEVVGWDRAERIAADFSVPCLWGSLRQKQYYRKEGDSHERSI